MYFDSCPSWSSCNSIRKWYHTHVAGLCCHIGRCAKDLGQLLASLHACTWPAILWNPQVRTQVVEPSIQLSRQACFNTFHWTTADTWKMNLYSHVCGMDNEDWLVESHKQQLGTWLYQHRVVSHKLRVPYAERGFWENQHQLNLPHLGSKDVFGFRSSTGNEWDHPF